METKTILITGSTDGIGKLVAIQLAKDGHQMLLHGRNHKKLQETIVEIKAITDNGNIHGFVSDLSDFKSIQKMIAELSDNHSKIDVLINNAGVFKSKIQSNPYGLDLRFAVNYFAPYLLTNGLMPLLKKSPFPKVINLSSAAQSPVSIEALRGNEIVSEQEAYAQSKLALTMWSFHLSKQQDFLNVVAVNPGSLLNTRMAQEAYGQFWSSADKGAQILYELAIPNQFTPGAENYFDNDQGNFSKAHKNAYDLDLVADLITETNKILGI
ncbi:SDR family NAD(P)-dependent oxidoreductase [Spongiimicrobium salis]|uniref:SDR family NAD(P)-dependent oxidoreductase n=1 Tax=Spongiimicrobium salis TaxID=1667022 RepID=UPI00374D8B05